MLLVSPFSEESNDLKIVLLGISTAHLLKPPSLDELMPMKPNKINTPPNKRKIPSSITKAISEVFEIPSVRNPIHRTLFPGEYAPDTTLITASSTIQLPMKNNILEKLRLGA